jgi:triosephosphate isomerase
MANARRPIVAGNWKMNTTLAEARSLADAVRGSLDALTAVDTAVCPPFISLAVVGEALRGARTGLGAQNCHFEPKGAFTGEIAPPMLVDLGCRYVILGHSERRAHFGEADELIARKVKAALANGLVPILCVGESLEQNEDGQTERIVGGQVRAGLEGLDAAQISGLVVAYEPVWAIGTGRAASAADANKTIGFIRRTIAEVAGESAAQNVRIQYGGSVTPANAAELFAQPEIDGALVGGASLKAPEFVAICEAAGNARPQPTL